jgi:chemotaxis response regulator CheB
MLEWHLAHVRVLVVDVQRLLRAAMMSGVVADSEIEIVSQVDTKDMLDAIVAFDPDVVVFGGETDGAAAELARIGVNYPMLRVVAVDADGRAATVFESGKAVRRETDISPRMMLNLIRGSAG